jgi:hypothetical protein
MISENLVKLIEDNADILTNNWLRDIRQNPTTPTYQKFPEEKLYQRAHFVYSQLGHWISRETGKREVREYYTKLGAERLDEGFALYEVVSAIILLKRHLWLHILSDGQLSTAFELYQSLELNNRVVLFFDRAIFYTIIGYEEALKNKLKKERGLFGKIFGEKKKAKAK